MFDAHHGATVKLSILMPVYNEEVRLGEALKQSLSVEYPCDVELVVVNDGSQDRTAEILDACDDPRVRQFVTGEASDRVRELARQEA